MNEKIESEQTFCMNMMMPRDLASALDAQARHEGINSRAAVIRRACLEYLRNNAPVRTRQESRGVRECLK